VLVLPDRAGLRVHRETLRAAMPVGVDLGQPAVPSDERIVVRRGSVLGETQHLASVHGRILRALLLLPLADGQVEMAVSAEDHPAAEIGAGPAPVLRN